jgi:microcystin-dependent protein
MTTLPAITYLDSARNQGEMKNSFFGPIIDVVEELLGGSAESELTISSGSITPTAAAHSVDTEGDAASDNLTAIDTTNHPEGRLLLIRAENGSRTVVVKHQSGGAGQITTFDGNDFDLDTTKKFLLLMRDGTDWIEVFRNESITESASNTFTGQNIFQASTQFSGSITFSSTIVSSILPEVTDELSFGSSSKRWAKIYSEEVHTDKVVGTAAVPAGTVIWWAGSTSAPSGYLKCNGAAVSRTTYADLFSAIGTTWGSGDGSTTFNVPDLRGEFVRGYDDGRGVDSGRAFASSQGQSLATHNHSASSGNDSHDHGGATGTQSANHTHSGTTSSNGAHTHGTNLNQPDAYDNGDGYTNSGSNTLGEMTTDSAGAHTHTFTTGNNSVNHTHSISGDTHNHTITVSNAGDGTENRPRNVAVLACIKY